MAKIYQITVKAENTRGEEVLTIPHKCYGPQEIANFLTTEVEQLERLGLKLTWIELKPQESSGSYMDR